MILNSLTLIIFNKFLKLYLFNYFNISSRTKTSTRRKKKRKAKRRPSLPAHGPSQIHPHRCLLLRNRLKPPPLPRGPPTRAWSQAMSAHVAAGGGDLRPSLRARASGKQIAPHEGSKQSSRPGRGTSQRSRR